jgi:hypothetical protein
MAGRKNVRRKELERLICKCCGGEFLAVSPRAGVCSSKCGSRLRHNKAAFRHACKECGAEFVSKQHQASYCCMGCHVAASIHRNAAWQQANPPILKHASRADAERLYGFRRRAAYAASTASFSSAEIFERDGWLCQICNEEVDRDLAWPHPKSASLDHRVPVSKGGTHEPANVQCAHLGCNSSKGARDRWVA